MKNFMFVVAALVIVSMTALAGGSGVSAPFVVTSSVAVTPIVLTPGTVDLASVKAGQKYVVVPDVALSGSTEVTPNDGALPVWTCTETNITGDPNAAVLVTHYLPSKLYGAIGGAPISYSTSGTSGIWGSASGAETNFFDPAVPTLMWIDASGAGLSIAYGGVWDVPVDASPGDVFTGNGLIVVEYTGAN